MKRSCLILVFFLFLIPTTLLSYPVDDNGWLGVQNSQLVNQKNIPIQLKGMSSHGIQWYGKFVNYNAMKELRDNWGLSVFRIAMYLNEGGYLSRPDLKNKMIEGIDAAINLGIYVIIDWHILSERDPNVLRAPAIQFFEEMATRYRNYPNVIYEIANEPNNTSWANNIRPYSIELYNRIRAIDPYHIIIVGTNAWSSAVEEAANNPLPPYCYNVMYALHFYAGSHGSWYRDKITYAMSRGAAIFVTEWGTTNYSGNGGNNYGEAQNWMNFLAEKKVSWTNWTISDHPESSAVLNVGANPNGGWTDANLKETGRFVKRAMLSK